MRGRDTKPGVLTVVLDPGHGGQDTGAIGPTGLLEKEVVLDVALRLRRLLQERLGVRVLMTRTEDVFVPLEERTAIANRAKADFFISLHVNGAAKRGAGGFETFYFTREPSDNDARASAQRENLELERNGATGVSQESLLKITLADMAVTRDMRESGQLAELVLTSLDKLQGVQNRGVKSGPFYVLATAAMPAVLVESAFITNPKEERKLQQEAYRRRVAEALFEGIAKYKLRYERRVGRRGGAATASGS
jgi:N-acetylmuramoyl-L-alanine amidase